MWIYGKWYDKFSQGYLGQGRKAIDDYFNELQKLVKYPLRLAVESESKSYMNPYDNAKWGVHVRGPDSVLAAASFQEAVEKANEFNQFIVMTKESFDSENYPIV